MDWVKALQIAAYVVAAASVATAAISQLTETKADDKAADFLGKLKKVLDALALNLKK